MPDAVVIAGANGAGKTTFARQFVPTLYPGVPFLNVDEIQAEDPALAHPVAAGRELGALLPSRLRREATGSGFAGLRRGRVNSRSISRARDRGLKLRTAK